MGRLPYELIDLFQEINRESFGGMLPAPHLTWNPRLRTSAGRFRPGRRSHHPIKAEIEIATYLADEVDAFEHIRNTLAHEMIHYWLWYRRRPYGHTAEFHQKMQEFGDIRYNPVPRQRPYKYIYTCPGCSREVPARKRLGTVACRACCDEHTDGKYHPRFKMDMKDANSA